jgi:hypothetical protein
MTDETKQKIADLRSILAEMHTLLVNAGHDLDCLRIQFDHVLKEINSDYDTSAIDLSVDCAGILDIADLIPCAEVEAEFFADDNEENVQA